MTCWYITVQSLPLMAHVYKAYLHRVVTKHFYTINSNWLCICTYLNINMQFKTHLIGVKINFLNDTAKDLKLFKNNHRL